MFDEQRAEVTSADVVVRRLVVSVFFGFLRVFSFFLGCFGGLEKVRLDQEEVETLIKG